MNFSITSIICACAYLCLMVMNINGLRHNQQAKTSHIVTCYNDEGEPVDWSITYNLASSEQGKKYIEINGDYIEINKRRVGNNRIRKSASHNSRNSWSMTGDNIDNKNSSLRQTLDPIFDKNYNIDYIFYNDQPPAGGPAPKRATAHSKGIVAIDVENNIGFWLLHSLPHFPSFRHQNNPGNENPDDIFNDNLGKFSQLFTCITFKPDKTLNEIAEYLHIIRVLVYEYELREETLKYSPYLELLANQKKMKEKLNQVTNQHIESYLGEVFSLYAKHGQNKVDIYTEVANKIEDDLLVMSWRRNGGLMPSNCEPKSYKVTNIESVEFVDETNGNRTLWPHTKDHSKWAITRSKTNGAISCFGDLNRAMSQMSRGGGLVCLNNDSVHKAFSGLIREHCDCIDNNSVKQSNSTCSTRTWNNNNSNSNNNIDSKIKIEKILI